MYGHENGLRVIWRPPGQSEEEQDEHGCLLASALYTVDIYLGGAEALCIDFPILPSNLHHDTKSIPTFLSERILVGVACSDFSIRVISVPITPSEPDEQSRQVILLAGEPVHQSVTTCLSLTFTPRQSSDVDNTNEVIEKNTPRSISSGSHKAGALANANWDLLIASASPDLSGRLMIHRIPFSNSSLDGSAIHCIPWKVHRLASPAVSLSFSSAEYPSPRHLQLLVAEEHGVVRIEDYMPQDDGSRGNRFLYPDFSFPRDQTFSKPKRILDCRWLLEGKAIVVLLTTGEWGTWDIQHVGPQSNEPTAYTSTSASRSQFAIRGWVQTKTAGPSTTFGDSKATSSKFVPLTPSTRKIRQATLFASEPKQASSLACGGISVRLSPPASSSRKDDNCVLMWYGTTFMSIPSFFTFWSTRVQGPGNHLGTSSRDEMNIISSIRFSGEACKEVSLDPCSTERRLVITAGRRLIMIESLDTQKRGRSGSPQAESTIVSPNTELLTTGELDLHAMDGVLESMANGHILKEISTETQKTLIKKI